MSANATATPRTERCYRTLLAYPRTVVLLSLLAILGSASGLVQLVKDTSVDAFIPPAHPSLTANDLARERFGLGDPIVIALVAPETIFTAEHLETIETLHRAIAALPGVRADRVMSLASESAIEGFADRIEVTAYLEGEMPASTASDLWQIMPPHQGTLVSEDGRGAIIVAELTEQGDAGNSYAAIEALLRGQVPASLTVHVAGQGAVVGHLSQSIDADSRVLQPLIFLVVLGILFLAFRRLAAVGLPLVIIIGAVGGALGVMAYSSVPYYAITSALPVILVAIAVADTIHVLSSYYARQAQAPQSPTPDHVLGTMLEQARPITLTTVTTIAGFLGIAVAEIMPPIVAFAQYAALGVGLAWLYAMTTLPCALVLLAPRPSRHFANVSAAASDALASAQPGTHSGRLTRIARASARAPVRTLAVVAILAAGAAISASGLRVDRALVEGFKASAPIRQADEAINARFAGTSFLDVMIEAPEPEGLLTASAMHRIAQLQAFLETLPRVQHTMAITDYLTLLHQAIETPGTIATDRPLPASDDAIAQYLLVYEAAGDPTDFEEEIDGQYQTAMVRAVLNTRYYSEEKAAVEALEAYLLKHWDGGDLTATISGRVNVRYHWMIQLAEHHFAGVVLSLALVFAIAALLFRSLGEGLLAVAPVSLTVLGLYAAMGALDIYLEPATTMFAAISLGLGVDFAIHLLARLKTATAATDDFDRALMACVPATARACFFNALALGAGFAVLLASELLTLKRFGGMVTAAALLSFVAALVLIPAGYRLLHEARGRRARQRALATPGRLGKGPATAAAMFLALGAVLASIGAAPTAHAGTHPAQEADSPAKASAVAAVSAVAAGSALAARIEAREDGAFAVREVTMTMTNRRGQTRTREALIARATGAEARRTLVVYRGPKAVRETAFLGYDYHADERASDQWLYLPALRKTRRIPASDRGDYFLGTDFTYEDMQSELKFDAADYAFERLAVPDDPEHEGLRGTPHTPAIAKELGYSAFEAWIDPVSLLPRRIEFADLKGAPLKVIEVRAVAKIDGIWTATDILARNLQTGHQTHFTYSELRFPEQLADQHFQATSLRRGIPRL